MPINRKAVGKRTATDALGSVTPEQAKAIGESVAAVAESSGKAWEAEEATQQSTERHTAEFYVEALKQAGSPEERESIRKAREAELNKVRESLELLRSSRTVTQRGMAYLPVLGILAGGAILATIGAKYINLEDVAKLLGRD
ncbi:hypothetical protein D5301_05515 [Stenotrophomonas sp. MH181796]|jgi:hypothetical protein|uniref:hypothetical protein n=1 Tax=Stenotrophomonas sp. MH181796 TaxID=2339228 RepID=UPI00129C5D41|nr:hypothetical protein [Stenotrophomonas sp. MH181796]MRI41701.1 hypothetical protein [Stenotrophomonas sp. MH181796]